MKTKENTFESCPTMVLTRGSDKIKYGELINDFSIQYAYWRRATSPYHGAPGATSRSPGRRLTGATWRPVSAGRGRSGNDGG